MLRKFLENRRPLKHNSCDNLTKQIGNELLGYKRELSENEKEIPNAKIILTEFFKGMVAKTHINTSFDFFFKIDAMCLKVSW
jgi:hypothetical protein